MRDFRTAAEAEERSFLSQTPENFEDGRFYSQRYPWAAQHWQRRPRSMSSFFCDVETHVSSPIVLRPLDRRVFRPPPLITDSEPALPTSRVQFKRSPIRSPTRSAVPPW